MKERPERSLEVNTEIGAMGGRDVSQFTVLGLYGLVNIVKPADS